MFFNLFLHIMDNLTRNQQLYCFYYQAHVERASCWFVVAVLKSFEHMSFDSTLNNESSLFEFFVPTSTERYFLQVMDYLADQGLVNNLKKLPNRLLDPAQKV